MARPAPHILKSYTDPRWITTDILRAPTCYMVLYRGEAFNIRKSNSTSAHPKYKRTSHTNRANADNLAARLNVMFRTDEFTVREVV
jgi:hypothetical protein